MTGLPCLACEIYLSCETAPFCPVDQPERLLAAQVSVDVESDAGTRESVLPEQTWQSAMTDYRIAAARAQAAERGQKRAPYLDATDLHALGEVQADAASRLLDTPALDIVSLTEKFAIVIDEFGDPDQVLRKLFKDLLRISRLGVQATKS